MDIHIRRLANGRYVAEVKKGFWRFKRVAVIEHDLLRGGDTRGLDLAGGHPLATTFDVKRAIRFNGASHALREGAEATGCEYAAQCGASAVNLINVC